MSHVRIVSIALVGLALSSVGAAKPGASTTQPAKEQPNLLVRVVEQARQIRKLEADLDASRQRERQLSVELSKLEHQLVVEQLKEQAQPKPDTKTTPPNWTTKQFNGMTFYLVPCDTAGGPSK